ncbi:MAG: T9SS type A sorting domain-containing protein [Janthinobacterium lividum]
MLRWVIGLWLICWLLTSPVLASGAGPALPEAATTPSLAEALNPDGTLRAGIQGTFAVRGYRFSQASDGRPQFRPTSPLGAGDASWKDGFGLNGTDGEVLALTKAATGEIYAGGRFLTAGTAPAAHIARWNGTSWSTLGAGIGLGVANPTIPEVVNAIAVDGLGNVYAGGKFTLAGGVAVSNIARWNGTNWSALGAGLNGEVSALAVDGAGNVYAGGKFTTAGGSAAPYAARWNGTSWSALSPTIPYPVTALAVGPANALYAAGGDQLGGAYVAKWDGTNWQQLGLLGAGLSTEALDLVADNLGNVYVGGIFNTAGGVACQNVAKWNGTAWQALGTGINKYVFALTLDGLGNLYAAGDSQGNQLYKWTGTQWTAVASTDGLINALAPDGVDGVVAGGIFRQASGGAATNYLASWKNARWSALGNGLDDTAGALAIDGSGNVYLGGSFTTVAGLAAGHVAKWDGTNWSTLGTGLNGNVYALALDGAGNLYAGGEFNRAGNLSVVGVAKWNGTSWSALGSGVTALGYAGGPVYALAIDGAGNVYAGGRFSKAGGVTAYCLAKWNGTSWSALGTPTGFDYQVNALLLDRTGNLYVGGEFTKAGGVTAKCIAKWNGTSWSALGVGAPGTVYALALDRAGTLYAGGSGTSPTSVAFSFITTWNGTNWASLATGTGSSVYALAFDGNGALYAGGDFTVMATLAARNIAKWDGTSWSTLGTGLNGPVAALALRGASPLCVAGNFTAVGDRSKATAYVGMYTTNAVPLPLATVGRQPSTLVQLYPNPAHGSFSINVPSGTAQHAELLTAQGQLVRQLWLTAPQTQIDTRFLAVGVYVVRLVVNGQVVTERLLIN